MQDNWTLTAVGYENVTYQPVDEKAEEWVEFWVIEGSAVNDSVKQKWNRHAGLVQCDIYTREGSGSRRQRVIMDAFKDLFSNVTVGDVRLTSPIVVNGAPPVTGFARKTIQIQFSRDEAD